jgi:hypothetical protein
MGVEGAAEGEGATAEHPSASSTVGGAAALGSTFAGFSRRHPWVLGAAAGLEGGGEPWAWSMERPRGGRRRRLDMGRGGQPTVPSPGCGAVRTVRVGGGAGGVAASGLRRHLLALHLVHPPSGRRGRFGQAV